MQYINKLQKSVLFRPLNPGDYVALHAYLQGLSGETKQRFGPHRYDPAAIEEFYSQPEHNGYLAIDTESNTVVAYAVVKMGYLDHDAPRLGSNGLALDHATDCTFAPSVTDTWQSSGVGQAMFTYILGKLTALNKRRIILWGGVQADNEKAMRFYRKNEFTVLGQFFYNGNNYDMVRLLPQG